MNALRIGWRNLMRNRRRTGITALAVALTTAICIDTMAIMGGVRQQMVDAGTRLFVGDVQAHAPGFRADRSIYRALVDPARLLAAAQALGIDAAPRSYGFGLVSHGIKSAGASFIGVEPAAERRGFDLPKEVFLGTYLADVPAGSVVIGRKLAKSLAVEVGDDLVAVVQAADGSLGNELFSVVGILKIVGEELDRGAVLLHHADFERLFVSDGRIHEIALRAHTRTPAGVVAALLPAAGAAVLETWRELNPSLSDMDRLIDASVYVFVVIFLLAGSIGVTNTMLMATHDRVREFGVVKALGATPWRILRDVTLEGFVLGLSATALGTIVGLAGGAYLQEVGIDLSGLMEGTMTFSGVVWNPILIGVVRPSDVLATIACMWVACILASLYPAVKVARLNPVTAMTDV